VLGVLALFVAYWRSASGCERLAAAEGERMKAIIYCDYGSPDVLELAEIPKPVPGDNQVLVRVRAASVNPYDSHFLRGEPFLMRIDFGLRKPKSPRIGVDFAGTVEAVGAKVTEFRPGDEVFGGKSGAFAEYVVAAETALARKPQNLTIEETAAVNMGGTTALQGLRDNGELQPGQKVLINGASGGVGTFAVQIAKAMGAEVTGVSSTKNVELVRSLGADHAVDYTKEDFTTGTTRYDLILDMVGNRSLSENRRVLTPNGKYVMVGGPKGRWLAPMDRALRAEVLSWFVSQEIGMMLAQYSRDDLNHLRDLIEAGKVKPMIDRRYPLHEVPEAIRYLETGRARGKVVITVP